MYKNTLHNIVIAKNGDNPNVHQKKNGSTRRSLFVVTCQSDKEWSRSKQIVTEVSPI